MLFDDLRASGQETRLEASGKGVASPSAGAL